MSSLPLFPELPRNKRKTVRKVKEPALPWWMHDESRILMQQTFSRASKGPSVLRASVLKKWKETKTLDDQRVYTGTFCPRDADVLRVEISDMHYSMGAMHYYAKVDLPHIRWQEQGNDNVFTSRAGLHHYLYTINITAPLLASEVRRDPDRYKGWKAGEYYPGFLTPQDAYNKAMGWIKQYTAGFTVKLEEHDYEITTTAPH